MLLNNAQQETDMYKKIDNAIRSDELKERMAFRKESDTMLVCEDGPKQCYISTQGDFIDNLQFKDTDDGYVLLYGVHDLSLNITHEAYMAFKLRVGNIVDFSLAPTGGLWLGYDGTNSIIALLPKKAKKIEIDLTACCAGQGGITWWSQCQIFKAATEICNVVRFIGFDKLFRRIWKEDPSLRDAFTKYSDPYGNKRNGHDTGYTDWSDYELPEDLFQ